APTAGSTFRFQDIHCRMRRGVGARDAPAFASTSTSPTNDNPARSSVIPTPRARTIPTRRAMRAEIYWIAGVPHGRRAVMPRPRGGDWLADEVRSLQVAGVDVLLSLLTNEEAGELDLAEEAACCAGAGIQFVSFPIPDRGVPSSPAETLAVVQRLAKLL